jgi:phage gp46-like protein
MRNLDRVIDPVTRDFVDAAAGGFVLADAVRNKLYLSFTLARGTWEGDPGLGHRFGELARVGLTDEVSLRLHDLVIDAAQWLLDSGELVQLDVEVNVVSRQQLAFAATATPPSGPAFDMGPLLISIGG